mgnify:CR=1 FL=1
MPKPDYAAEHKKALRANAAAIPAQVLAGDANLKKKIANFAERHGYTVDEVLKKIKKDPMFAAHFAVDPSRQNLYETIAARYIGALPLVNDFKKLHNGALSVLQGAVMSKKELDKQGGTSRAKTIDFAWDTCGKQIYASHKYTRDEGGAQDNQYGDIQQFIREARDSTLKNTIFLAIVDGPYYEGARLSVLKSLANNRNVFAMSIDELPRWLKSICKK